MKRSYIAGISMNISAMRTALARNGQVLKSAVQKPVVVATDTVVNTP